MLSMAACLVFTLLVACGLSTYVTAGGIAERVVQQELPAVVGEIRNDLLREIAKPLASAQDIAGNDYVLGWEKAGLPDTGLEAWQQYAASMKSRLKANKIFWVSGATGKYFTEAGLARTLDRSAPASGWFNDFLREGKPYTLRIDRDVTDGSYKLFINVRFDGGSDKQGIAGLALSIDSLAERINSYKVGPSGYVYLVRPDGTLLAHRQKDLVDGKHGLTDLPGFTKETSAELLKGGKYSSTTYHGAQGTQIVAASFVPELDLYVIAEVPESEAVGALIRRSTFAAVAAGIAGVAIGLLVVYAVSRAIAAPVARAAAMLGEIADGNGDLTRRMKVETNDEIGALATAFNRFASSLNQTIGKIRIGADTIAHASNEIATGNMDLSGRTESQAGSLEETASTMEELTATVRQNADNARQANQLVTAASDYATQGGNVVGEVVQTMAAIKDSSNKIVDIIAVIDGIAFQTNILALNAAVEAARAGEQGRGFAVVASEVRTLAQRSAAAAKEIKELINDSVNKVDAGGKLVDNAGDTMQHIVTSVRRVADIMGEISEASREQSEGIGQINDAITQMDDATQQNAALVEEAAAAAQSLQDQAAQLAEAVAAFKLDMSQVEAAPAPALQAPRAAVALPRPAKASARPVAKKPAAPARKTAAPAAADEWEEF
ncbi:methyl-accepting chemotaxis protein [Pseudoduganella ginsengisoli]|uniref:HAMP domain-containing protein n=1 Tax=Pseudoduganella ginsengisoli TaxID=1462440 RepID=A0A6L6Q695_9BURK|nr:methyl-accepting chemotaxis protein [Pseudoduganella ginsengisoli]MTW05297.1 HAMP domain-containing protein [Pseudoduganella ginsengisoli]